MKNRKIFISMLAIATALTFTACDDDDEDDDMPVAMEPTLYEKLGGTAMVEDPNNPGEMIETGRLGLRSVVDSSIFVIAGDPILSPYFETLLMELGSGNTTGFEQLSLSLTNFFSVATGAENFEYNGLDMVTAHDPEQNLRMSQPADDAAFDAFIGAVGMGAEQNSVPEDLIGEVAALIETLRDPIVQE
ncbi:MAG: group 1 truncated hemoglobin [Cryomorphaceae bacterium]